MAGYEYEGPPTVGLPVVSPANMLPVQVAAREVVAPGVVSVFLVLPGTQQAPAPYLPGQFVTLALPTPRETLYRSYSLCGDGDASRPWELTIKRMHMGRVSEYFYDSVKTGTLLYASLPRGTFTLPAPLRPQQKIMMIALGSGITPIMGMIRAINRMQPDERPLVQLHYSSKSPRDMIFGSELDQMDQEELWLKQRYYFSTDGNRMTVDRVLMAAGRFAADAHWYMCGPESLKRELQQKLERLGVPASQVHSEVFATSTGPAYRVESRHGEGVGGSIRISDTDAVLDVRPQETLLAALERHGYRPDFSCRAGACGSCRLKVLAGQVDPVGEVLTPGERAEGYVLSCIARPIGDVTLASGGRPPSGVARVAGAAGGSRESTTRLVRMGALVSVGALLAGTWQLTNHRPTSWGTVSNATAAPPAHSATSPASTATPAPNATARPAPTATPVPASSANNNPPAAAPAPTPTSAPAPAPTATPAPAPTPVATSTTTPAP